MELCQHLWLYLAFALCGAVGCHLFLQRSQLCTYKLISGLSLICIPLHMFEERIYPGGFHYIVGLLSGGGQTQTNVMLMNSAVLIILTILFVQKGDKGWFTCLVSFLGLMECTSHTIAAVMSYRLFHDAGLFLPYSPGYFVCLFLFLPLSIWGFCALRKAGDFKCSQLKWTFLWLMIICVCTLAIPNRLLHGIGEPFPSLGFYTQFVN